MSSDREEDHRSVLATIGQFRSQFRGQFRESLVLSARDEEAAQAVAAGLRDAKAANTRRVYASAWHEFNVWALANGRQSLPAEPQTVALYLGRLAADGRAMATIALARAAISHAHAAEGTAKGDNPARHPVVAETVKGWRNQAPAPKQASALTAEALARIRETARLPRRGRGGRMETPAAALARAAVDLAIIGVMADGGLRRSESAALTWGASTTIRTARPASPSRRGRTSLNPGFVPLPELSAWAKTSPDTAAASAWPGGWWPQERRTQRSRTKGDGSTAIWWPATPRARPPARR